MKLTHSRGVWLATLLAAVLTNTLAQTLPLSTNESKIIWTGTKLTGYHQGVVNIKEGNVVMKENRLAGGYVVVDMNTIVCTDIPASDPIPKRKLEDHLKDADFFNVVKFPAARFVITEVRPHPANPARYLVYGNLTIKQTTRLVTAAVTPTIQSDQQFIGEADLRFNRQLFGVSYKGIKDELVHDEVQLRILIKTKSS
ncbi:MAG: YceI family protein [Cyclobacteriaceae bacterium]|nr:YceI family protein [Cyclobacteriaceae bacterium]